MAISRMNMERQLRAGGGIMTLEEPRQGYFLGKIVKKAKRAVKKVVKSPLGKMAMIGALGFGIPGTQIGGLFGRAGFGGAATGLLGKQGIAASLPSLFGVPMGPPGTGKQGLFGKIGSYVKANPGKSALLGLGAASFLPMLMGGDEEEVPETSFTETPDSIASIVNMAKNQDPSLRFLPKPKFVDNFYLADGGLAGERPGYSQGEMVEGVKEGIETVADDENMMMAGMGNVMKLFENYDGSFDRGAFEDMLIQYEDSGAKANGVKLMDFAVDFLGISSMKEGGLASIDTPKRGMVDGAGSYAGEKPSFLDNFLSAIGQIKSGQVSANLRGDEEKSKEFVVKEGFGTNFDEDQIAQIIDMKNRGMDLDSIATFMEADPNEVRNLFSLLGQNAFGGRIGKAEGGLMDLGGLEKDYREGGFVPLGAEERADDVPARLSKNEFVFTADAVRNAGQGDIDKGAEVMQNMMDNLEAGGTISEESQGMNPAQEMFDQTQMLEGRLA